jgi:hypothetical protein
VQLRILKLSCSLLLCLLVLFASAQQPEKPDTVRTTKKKTDTVKVKFYPRSFRLGTDLISLIRTQTDKTYSGWEVNADVDCGKYYFAFDYGHQARDYTLPYGGDYHNAGSYWRAGVDINLLKKDPDRNMFFFGIRYGGSSYSESATIVTIDPYFGEIVKPLNNAAVTANWVELISGLRVRMWKQFWMGYTARMKFAHSVKGDTQMTTYDVPGYGIHEEGIYWGFNYQIFWSIPLVTQKKPRVAKE